MIRGQSHPHPKTRSFSPGFAASAVRSERRAEARTVTIDQGDLPAVMRSGLNGVWMGKAINLSRRGMLIEFPPSVRPMVRMNESVSIKLQYEDDVVWVAGIVKHRHGNRMGIFFPHRLHHVPPKPPGPSRSPKAALTPAL